MRAASANPSTRMSRPGAAEIWCSGLLPPGPRGGLCCGDGSVETLTHGLQIGGQGRLEAPTGRIDGVVEGERVGVQERTFHGHRLATTVAGVAHHRMSDGREV